MWQRAESRKQGESFEQEIEQVVETQFAESTSGDRWCGENHTGLYEVFEIG